MKHFRKSSTISDRGLHDPRRIRVLVAGHLPPPIGGVGTYYQSLVNSSLPERVDFQFVQTSTHNRDLSQSGRATYSNLIAAVKDCLRFTWAILSHRPQVCHIGTAFGLSFLKHGLCVVIARVLGCRVLLHPHCSLYALYWDCPDWWRLFFRQVIRLTNGVIGLSSEWEQLSQIVPGKRVYYLSNAIDLTAYQSIAEERFAHPKKNGAVHILFLGYIGRAKGSYELLEAAQCICSEGIEVRFDLVGSELTPGEVDHVRQRIEETKVNEFVRIHPPVMDDEKLACFRDADIFAYPSYSEGMPMAVIEAMASGLPIIASKVGGLPDLVSDGVNGFLVEPGCSDELATALQQLSTDTQLRKSMGENSACIAHERYDIEQHVLKLVDIYTLSIHHSQKDN